MNTTIYLSGIEFWLYYHFRSPVLLLDDKTIRLAHRFSSRHTDASYMCALFGSLNIDPG